MDSLGHKEHFLQHAISSVSLETEIGTVKPFIILTVGEVYAPGSLKARGKCMVDCARLSILPTTSFRI